MTNINYLVFIWNVFVDTLLLLIIYAWKMYDIQTLHAGGIPMFRGTYLVEISSGDCRSRAYYKIKTRGSLCSTGVHKFI